MKILIVNAGSSSLKYQLVDMDGEKLMAKGLVERIGIEGSKLTQKVNGQEIVFEQPIKDHTEACSLMIKALTDPEKGAVKHMDEIGAVGHRVLHGGEAFTASVLINEEVKDAIRANIPLGPLHNPANLMGIEACREQMPGKPMVAVFDTSFFQTIPPKAYMYPLPYELYEKHAIRKYGAHGTSHRYIAERAAAFMDEPLEDLKLITCHLGNGCSISAIDHGVAVDTSMGLTPLDGLMMGTRCGAIDPAIVPFIMEKENLTAAEVNDLMNKKSGLLGISGISNDLRSVRQASEEGDERAQLAYDMYSNSAKKYIGQYIAVMGGVDAIVLTAGVGENCDKMRRMIFAGLQPLGIKIDLEKNRAGLRGEREISTDDSEVRIVIIPTDEEYMIARDTYQLVKEGTLEITELV